MGLVSPHQFPFVLFSVLTCFHLFLAGLIMMKMSGPKSWLFPVDQINAGGEISLFSFLSTKVPIMGVY